MFSNKNRLNMEYSRTQTKVRQNCQGWGETDDFLYIRNVVEAYLYNDSTCLHWSGLRGFNLILQCIQHSMVYCTYVCIVYTHCHKEYNLDVQVSLCHCEHYLWHKKVVKDRRAHNWEGREAILIVSWLKPSWKVLKHKTNNSGNV